MLKFIEEARDIFAKVFKKIDTLENTLKFYFKKNLNLGKDKLDTIEKELKTFVTKCENYYQYNTTVYNFMNELKGKFKVNII